MTVGCEELTQVFPLYPQYGTQHGSVEEMITSKEKNLLNSSAYNLLMLGQILHMFDFCVS